MTQKERKRKQEEFLKVLPEEMGILGKAAEKIGIHPNTISRWRKDDADFDEEIKVIQSKTDDYVESRFFDLVREGNKDAILFYLKTKMRDKYTEVKKVEVKDLDFRFKFGTADGEGETLEDMKQQEIKARNEEETK